MADYGPPIVNFSKFDPIGSYQEGRKISRQNALEDAFSKGIPLGPDGTPDYAAMLKTVAQYGDLGTAIKLGALAQEQKKLGLSEQASRDFLGSELFGGSGAGTKPSTSRGPGFTGTQNGRQYIGGVGIYDNDEPSPLDPPSGRDRDLAIRTVYGEAANEPPQGQAAVANVIRNRTVAGRYGGETPSDVVTAPGQFEPFSRADARARMAALDPNSAEYKRLGQIVDSAYFGANDPTGGATHFYAPQAQAALGRDRPAWAQGPGQPIGGHTFYSPDAPTEVSARQRQGPAPQQEAPGVPTSPAQNPAAGQIPALM